MPVAKMISVLANIESEFGGASRDRTDDPIVANDVVAGATTKAINHLDRSEHRSIGTEWNVIQPRSGAVCLIALRMELQTDTAYC